MKVDDQPSPLPPPRGPETVFLKLIKSPGMDSKESIPPASEACGGPVRENHIPTRFLATHRLFWNSGRVVSDTIAKVNHIDAIYTYAWMCKELVQPVLF